jgi:glycosyltransferase involved in cell wall biosynthesis
MQPLVSVIILAYRHPVFLNQLLACIAKQTYKNVEIVIVDDASGAEFTSQYQLPANARLLVNEKNIATASISRNRALRVATGKHVAFTDQDDIWEAEKLELQVKALEANPSATFHYTHFRPVDVSLDPLSSDHRFVPLGRDALKSLLWYNTIAYSSVMARRSSLDAVGLFDESIRGAADWDMWLRLAAEGPVLADPRPLLLRRQHGQQWSKSSLMMARGAESVVAKAVEWIPKKRRDLRGMVYRRHGRWQRELARAELDAGDPEGKCWPLLWRAARLQWWDSRVYTLMMRKLLTGKANATGPKSQDFNRNPNQTQP